MVTKIHIDALRSEAASLKALIKQAEEYDPLGALTMHERLVYLEKEISSNEEKENTKANVAVVFDGDPVTGSSAIDANFAGNAIKDYQEVIERFVAVENGHFSTKGKIPENIKNQSRLNISSLVHGSFGFVMEEADTAIGQSEMFDSAAKKAIQNATNLFERLSAGTDQDYEHDLTDIDSRIFYSVRRFVKLLHDSRATFKIYEQKRDIELNLESVSRAYDRLIRSEVKENDMSVKGTLLGLVPLQKRFDFKVSGTGEFIQGKVSEALSEQYLEKIDQMKNSMVKTWDAVLTKKEIRYPDTSRNSTSFMLIDLKPS